MFNIVQQILSLFKIILLDLKCLGYESGIKYGAFTLTNTEMPVHKPWLISKKCIFFQSFLSFQ